MEKYKLTVVTTTYNQEKYIEECIKSVLMQKTDFDFQHVICDDKSTDSTVEIVKKYQAKYPDKIKLIVRENNLGPMDNFVATLNDVHTQYVALCDGDDFWTDEAKLQKQVDFLDKNNEYSMCFHKVKIFYDDNSQPEIIYPNELKNELSLDDLVKENFIVANSVVYRWAYQKKDSFKNDFPKDIIPGDYYVHLIHAGKGKIYYIDELMSCYRRQNQGMWWMTSQPHLKNKFYLTTGAKMLKFYEEVENKLNLDKSKFRYTKEWIINEILESYLVYYKYKELKKFIESKMANDEYKTYPCFSKKKIMKKAMRIFLNKLKGKSKAVK